MVQDARRPDPQYKGLIHGTGQIIKNEGFRGVYRGLFPVIMKQGTNSAVRFTSYQCEPTWRIYIELSVYIRTLKL
jgi:solute carrier family 25 (mitochondrial citrate transporter), member 1